MSDNPLRFCRTKNIDVRVHLIRASIASGDIEVNSVRSETHVANVMTKPLASPSFKEHRRVHMNLSKG